MPPRIAQPQKKPSGGRPLSRRLMSWESQQSNISSTSSDASATGYDVDSMGRARGPSKSSTLRLVEEDSGQGSSFSAWTQTAVVHSPETELEYISYQSDVTTPHVQENARSSPRRPPPRPLPLISERRTASRSRSDGEAIISPEPGGEMSSSDKTASSSKQRSNKPQALSSQLVSASPATIDRPTVRSPPSENDTFSVRSDMSAPVSEKTKSSPNQRPRMHLTPPSRPASLPRSETLTSVPPSPSKAHWNHLRQHVLPSSRSSLLQVAPTPPTTTIAPSSILQVAPVPSGPRSQAPKSSRLARLGFKQVVDHVRDIATVDNRKFTDEILKVCWQARFMDPAKGSKANRDPVLEAGASNLYLPFMSNSSLVNVNDSTSTLNQLNQKPDMKRPPSMQSLALTSRQVPTIKYIHSLLLRYATPSADQPRVGSILPHESQLLSALLTPYTTRASGSRADEERWFSIESFEIAVKTWKAATNQVSCLQNDCLEDAYICM